MSSGKTKNSARTILHIPSWVANDLEPYAGNFINKHIESIAQFERCITLKIVKNSCKKAPIFDDENPNNVIISYFIKRRSNFIGRIINKIETLFLYKKAARKIVKKYGAPDFVHLHVALPNGIFAAKIARKFRCPLVLTEHWSLYQLQNFVHATLWQRWQLRRIFSQLAGFTAVSENLRGAINQQFPNLRNRVIFNVVNTDKFLPITTCKSTSYVKTIIHISTLDEAPKNISGMLRAIDLLRQQRQDFRLEIIHEKVSEAAERQVAACDLGAFVHFCGSKTEDEVAAALTASDFLLLFSNYENLPCVLCEALSCGKPVVTTAVGGIPEIIDGTRGIFVKTANEADLVEQLDFMLDHFHEFDSAKSREFALSNFSQQKIGKQFSDFYEMIQF